MDNQKIIIALLCVIIAILVVGIAISSPFMAKEKSNLAISNNEINAGDSLIVALTDGQGNPIANQTVNVKLIGNDGTSIDKDVRTNIYGKAKFKVEETGKYSVECKFNGNDKYASSSTADNISVEKAATKLVSEEKNSDSVSSQGNEREEYKITPDGWNPREHEVSRESIGGGKERVHYDDNYFRVVDQDGNIITHGWE